MPLLSISSSHHIVLRIILWKPTFCSEDKIVIIHRIFAASDTLV